MLVNKGTRAASLTLSKLVLFDIDGTLLSTGRAPRRAISRALRDVFQIEDDLDGLSRASFAGKTDPEIIRAILARNDYHADDIQPKLSLFFQRYTRSLEEELPGEAKARLYPGVRELLQELRHSGSVILSLLTGNIRDGAMIKLRFFSLDAFFEYGSFGSDSGDRSELPAIAVRRVREGTGQEFSGKDVVIIGDTLADFLVSTKYGAKSVLVATGFYPYEELSKVEPDYLFEDFSSTDEVVKAILA
jgi:phosphoglycolate phosphatase